MMKTSQIPSGKYMPAATISSTLTVHADTKGWLTTFQMTRPAYSFKDTIDKILNADIAIPDKLKAFMNGEKQSTPLEKDFDSFKEYLLSR